MLLELALRSLPSQGRRGSWVSRRDRALLILHGSAGLSAAEITDLTAGDVWSATEQRRPDTAQSP